MTGSWCLLHHLLSSLHIVWPRLCLATISSWIAPWAFNLKHSTASTNIDPTRCLKMQLCESNCLSAFFLFLFYFLRCVFYCETSAWFSQRNWLMSALWTCRFYIPILSPGCRPQGLLQRKGYVGGLEGTVLRCVNTQPATVWPEDRLNQYREATSGWDYVKCLFSRVFWSCDRSGKL